MSPLPGKVLVRLRMKIKKFNGKKGFEKKVIVKKLLTKVWNKDDSWILFGNFYSTENKILKLAGKA